MAVKILPYVSPTALDTFNDCRQQWLWSRRGGYQTGRIAFALELGTGVHAALAEYYKAMAEGRKVSPVKAFILWWDERLESLSELEDQQIMSNIYTYGVSMLEDYVAEYAIEGFTEVLMVEEVMTRPIPGTDWSVLVRLDALVRDGRRRVWVLEHKTFTSLYEEHLDRVPQFALEAWTARGMGPVEGVIYNGLRKSLHSANASAPPYVRRWLPINRAQEVNALKRARDAIRTITSPDLVIYPNPGPFKCNWCSFRKPCTAKMQGKDYKSILAHDYFRRPVDEEFDDMVGIERIALEEWT